MIWQYDHMGRPRSVWSGFPELRVLCFARSWFTVQMCTDHRHQPAIFIVQVH